MEGNQNHPALAMQPSATNPSVRKPVDHAAALVQDGKITERVKSNYAATRKGRLRREQLQQGWRHSNEDPRGFH